MAQYAIQGIQTPSVDGVQVKRHPLEREASRLNSLARRVGLRLTIMMRAIETKEHVLERVVGKDETGRHIREPVLDQNGQQIIVPILPDEDFRENWKLYQRTVMDLLQEQRARAALADTAKQPIDDATFNAQLKELAKQALEEMSDGEIKALLARRALNVPTTPVVVGEPAVVVADTSTSAEAEDADAADVLTGFDDDT